MKVSRLMKCAFAGILTLVLFSCAKEEAAQEPKGKWGQTKEVKVSSAEGTKTVAVTSDGQWTASLAYESKTWISIKSEVQGSGNGQVELSYRANDGLPRAGVLYISSLSGSTVDTVIVKQYGIEPYVKMDKQKLTFSSVGSSSSITMDTNIPVSEYENMTVSVDYTDSSSVDWVVPSLSADFKSVTVTVDDNPSFFQREAFVWVSHRDAWGEIRNTSFTVVQEIPGGTEQTVVKSFADVRAMASTDGRVVNEDIAIEGYIISDKDSQNMGDCPEVSATACDYTENDRTAYIESKDGSMGFKLLFTDGKDNNTKRYAKTKLWIKGAVLTKETDPDRYTISGLGSSCIIASTEGTAESLPVKKKYIKNLTDDDIYTYVTLKKCEFPIRRGGLIMFYNTSYAERMSKYPQIISDIQGSSIRLLFNLKSPIATSITTGSPKGQGPVSGIVVHEIYYRYSPADGNMGRYQIRNVSASDIAVSSSLNDSYSVALVEWADNASDGTARRVRPSSYGYEVPGDPWVIQPTSGTGAYYFYNVTNPTAGQWPAISSAWCSNAGFGAVGNAMYGYNSWYNADAQDYNYAIWKFSTKGISSDMVTFCLAGRGHAANGGVPYYYLDYSTDGGESWKNVAEFVIPAQSAWSPTTQGTIAAETPSFFVIPNDILDLDVAMIRMIPSRDIIGTAAAWDGDVLSSGNVTPAYTDICYSAVRYKK